MDLTTIERVRARGDFESIAASDAVLEEFIVAVSKSVEELMARHVLEAERTEVVRVDRFKRTITLPGRPIVSVAELKVGTRPDLSSASATDATAYDVLLEQGQIRLNWSPSYEPTYIEVTYTGGMALTTDAFVTAYPDIADAVDVEVIHRWNRRKTPGSESTTFGDGGVARTSAYGLHQHLRDVVGRYRIRRL